MIFRFMVQEATLGRKRWAKIGAKLQKRDKALGERWRGYPYVAALFAHTISIMSDKRTPSRLEANYSRS